MSFKASVLALIGALVLAGCGGGAALQTTQRQSVADAIAAAPDADWRGLDLANTLVMTLDTGAEVVIELAPAFAPLAAANIVTLADAAYFDGLAINRVQENYVVQWGDPNAGEAGARDLRGAAASVPAEFARPWTPGLVFTRLPDPDAYTNSVGYIGGFPAARGGGEVWLAHCYGMVGVGRDTAPDSGSGAELYVVTGHSPRHLDRNITLVGRVWAGMEALTALPRGTGPLGFYETPAEVRPGIASVRRASLLPGGGPAGRLQVLRTDTESYRAFVEARRHRIEEWFYEPAGRIDLCNAAPPTRRRP